MRLAVQTLPGRKNIFIAWVEYRVSGTERRPIAAPGLSEFFGILRSLSTFFGVFRSFSEFIGTLTFSPPDIACLNI
jgi:hypothetical protein